MASSSSSKSRNSTAEPSPPVYARYIAQAREFVLGVPPHDMTRAEWESTDPDARAQALALGLYEINEE